MPMRELVTSSDDCFSNSREVHKLLQQFEENKDRSGFEDAHFDYRQTEVQKLKLTKYIRQRGRL